MIRTLIPIHALLWITLIVGGETCNGQSLEFKEIIKLNKAVKENSGIVIHQGIVYTHNDSGDGPYIYHFPLSDPGTVSKTKLTNANNTDWEDMAFDGDNVFVFDTGTNNKSRKKMTYYKVALSALNNQEIPETGFESVDFKFKDEYGETKKVNCEAATVVDGDLIFISKAKSNKADIYLAKQGEDEAHFQTEIKIPVEITGVTTYDDKIYFCGYDKIGDNIYTSKIGYLTRSPVEGWKKPTFVLFEGIIKGQCEGIFIADDVLYVSTEENLLAPPKLYLIDIFKLKS